MNLKSFAAITINPNIDQNPKLISIVRKISSYSVEWQQSRTTANLSA
jgi:hypothetical protein